LNDELVSMRMRMFVDQSTYYPRIYPEGLIDPRQIYVASVLSQDIREKLPTWTEDIGENQEEIVSVQR
jgi:hypothetical protein